MKVSARSAQAASADSAHGDEGTHPLRQYLTFVVGGENYGIAILGVKEIIEYDEVTPVPMMPACIRGVINLRGTVVPVLDLASRFGRGASVVTRRTCIVIVEVGDDDDARQDVGVVVDSVNAVIELVAEDIQPAPAFGARIRVDFIEGMGRVNGRFVVLLDMARVLSSEEIGALAALDLAVDERPTQVGE